MINVQQVGKHAIIDVREQIMRGEHPRGEIIQFTKGAPIGTIIEIHMPFRGEPLIAGLEAIGQSVIVNHIGPGHVRLMTVKL